tara:strand:+ start:249 stop:1547 length:1299 start_codon:yes stop_codon:yes gene_type:complete
MSNSFELPPSPIPFLDDNYPVGDSMGGQPIVIKRDPKVLGLGQVVNTYQHNTAPENFQRPESWSKKEKKAFFKSLLMDRIEGVIVVVDVDSALHRVKQVAPEDRAISNIFEPILDQGLKFIVLDGNNRLQFLLNLINDIYGIPEGRYEYIRHPQDTSTSVFRVTRKNNKFSNLPQAVQDTLLERLIIMSVYTQIGYDGMSEVFVNTNSGVFPNPQELRNAKNSPWADYVRALRSQIPELIGYMFSNPTKRYCADDWIVDCLDFALNAVEVDLDEDSSTYKETNFSAISQSSKNDLYDMEFLSAKEQVRFKTIFTDLAEILNQLIDETSAKEEIKYLKTKTLIQNLFFMMYHGLSSYDHVKEAIALHKKAYHDKSNFFYPKWSKKEEHEDFNDLTFKNACEGARKINIEFRHLQLMQIVTKVIGTELNSFFNI